ncbi:MAG: hypothetical protein ACYDH9_09680 [Limisphaerales bacterium]
MKKLQGGTGANQFKQKSQSDTSADTASAIAAKHGVSRATVIRDGKRAEAIDKLAETKPEEAKAVRDGKRANGFCCPLSRRHFVGKTVFSCRQLPT